MALPSSSAFVTIRIGYSFRTSEHPHSMIAWSFCVVSNKSSNDFSSPATSSFFTLSLSAVRRISCCSAVQYSPSTCASAIISLMRLRASTGRSDNEAIHSSKADFGKSGMVSSTILSNAFVPYAPAYKLALFVMNAFSESRNLPSAIAIRTNAAMCMTISFSFLNIKVADSISNLPFSIFTQPLEKFIHAIPCCRNSRNRDCNGRNSR